MPASSAFSYSYTGQVVTFTVPQTGLYDILAFGAQGGGGGFSGAGGLGAEIGGDFLLMANQVLTIAVGGAGKIDGDAISGGGGGGGSFAVLNGQAGSPDTALVVAAGGGGGTYIGPNGGDGQVGPNGQAGGNGAVGNLGGTPGAGGAGGTLGSGGTGGGGASRGYGAGGGGGGFNSSGGIGGGGFANGGFEPGGGGASFAGGLAGGIGGYHGDDGGFGGGGGGSYDGGGGGGGYSGGGGGGSDSGNGIAGRGGGGGSFDGSTLSSPDLIQLAAVQIGDGSVSITPLFTLTNTAPAIGGTAGRATTDKATVSPFSTVTVTDPDVGQTETATVTLSAAGNGALSNLGSGSLSSNGLTYTVSGMAAQVQAALRGLVFSPTQNEVPVGQTVTTGFSLAVSDGTATTTDTTTSVAATSAEDAPTITGLAASTSLNDKQTATPFASVLLTDPDTGRQTETITLTLTSGGAGTDANGTLSLSGQPGFTLTNVPGSTGTYQLTGGTSGSGIVALQAALRAVVFTPMQNQVAPGQSVTTGVGASLSDGLQSAAAATSLVVASVNDPASISGTATGSATEDGILTTSGQVTVSDSDLGQSVFQAPPSASLAGTYGAFTFDPSNGSWSYTLTNASPLVQALAAGQTVTDILNVSSLDGTATQPITVTVKGSNDAPTLTTQTLSAASVAGGQTTANLYNQVLANVQDVDISDQGKLTITGVSPAAGTTGAAFLDPARGVLTYTADAYNAAHPTDSFTYTASDPHGATVRGTVTVPITPGTLQGTVRGTPGNDTLTANGAGAVVFAGRGDDVVTVNGSHGTVYGGTGTNTIRLNGAAQTVVLEQGGLDQISGFNLNNDVLDLRQVLAEAQLALTSTNQIGSYFGVTSSGSNATLSLTPAAQVPGSSGALATLLNVGPGVTLQTLISDGALKVA